MCEETTGLCLSGGEESTEEQLEGRKKKNPKNEGREKKKKAGRGRECKGKKGKRPEEALIV